MPRPPQTSPLPPPIFMPQSSSCSIPSATPIPVRRKPATDSNKDENADRSATESGSSTFTLPKLRLEVRDLVHPGSRVFLSSVVPATALEFSVRQVLDLLYLSPKTPHTTVPGTRSVTLILQSMDGVAYTTGTELDGDHKEIHFSVEYINGITKSRKADEILGVLVHEMVHCYQYNARGTCPGGLVEGIADWVRLNSNLAPPHWDRAKRADKWDAGYQNTGYFLDYLEKRYGSGTISKMNEKLRTDKYEEKRFWTELLGRPVEQLWADYGDVADPKKTSSAEPTDAAADDDDELVMIEKEDAHTPRRMSTEDKIDQTPTPTAEPVGQVVREPEGEVDNEFTTRRPPAGVV